MTAKKTPTLETKTVSEARRTFSETLNRVFRGETRVLIEKNGIPVGVLVSPRDLADIEQMQRRRDDLRAALEDIRSGFKGIPEEELERELGKALAEARELRREEHSTTARRSA